MSLMQNVVSLTQEPLSFSLCRAQFQKYGSDKPPPVNQALSSSLCTPGELIVPYKLSERLDNRYKERFRRICFSVEYTETESFGEPIHCNTIHFSCQGQVKCFPFLQIYFVFLKQRKISFRIKALDVSCDVGAQVFQPSLDIWMAFNALKTSYNTIKNYHI